MKRTEAGSAVGDERTHAELVRKGKTPGVEVDGVAGTRRVVARGDVGERFERQRLVRALVVLRGQLDGAPRTGQGVVPAPDAQVRFRQPRPPHREPQSHCADRRLPLDRIFEEGNGLPGSSGQCVGVPEAGEEIHVPGALGSNEREATFERPAGTIQLATLEMDAPSAAYDSITVCRWSADSAIRIAVSAWCTASPKRPRWPSASPSQAWGQASKKRGRTGEGADRQVTNPTPAEVPDSIVRRNIVTACSNSPRAKWAWARR